jgi:hypothetical protein
LGENKDLRAKIVPLNLGLLGFKERLPAGRRSTQVKQGMDVNVRRLALLFGDKDSDGGIEAGTEHDSGCSLDLESASDALLPFSGVKNLNLGTNKANSMGFRNSILNTPSVLVLLREGYELLPSGDREDAQVLVLNAISELDMTLPRREICPAWRKPEFNNIRNC